MAKLYRSREGQITAVDTKSQLTTLGSETAPGPLVVPTQATVLKAVIAALATDQAAAADAAFFIRLEGPGLPEGPETFTIGAQGVAVATGGHGSRVAQRFEVNIPITVSNEVLIFAEMAGEDVGTVTIGVTLEFETA